MTGVGCAGGVASGVMSSRKLAAKMPAGQTAERTDTAACDCWSMPGLTKTAATFYDSGR
jgi:hypothetical protein